MWAFRLDARWLWAVASPTLSAFSYYSGIFLCFLELDNGSCNGLSFAISLTNLQKRENGMESQYS